MALSLINTGTVAGDGTGDNAQAAFIKANLGISAINVINGVVYVFSNDPTYNIKMDGVTDSGAGVNAWFAVCNALAAAGQKCRAVLRADAFGYQCLSTLRNHALRGDVELAFEGATYMLSGGSLDNDPLIIWGTDGTRQTADGFNLAFISQVSHNYYNLRHMPIRFLCKVNSKHYFRDIQNYTLAAQYAATTADCAYNHTYLNQVKACAYGIEEITMSNNTTAFCAENYHHGGNFESTSSLLLLGSGSVWRRRRYYNGTAYANSSGSCWEPGSGQIANTTNVQAWAPSTTFARHTRLLGTQTGGEWLVDSTSGATGTTEPTNIPVPVTVTGITTVAGNAQVTMASTAGLSPNMRVEAVNPQDNFPINTYINSVDDGTHVTLSQTARVSSAVVAMSFTAPTTDGAATLYYLGDFVRSQYWAVDCGRDNWQGLMRCEGGVGEMVVVTGQFRHPRTSSAAGAHTFKGHSPSNTSISRLGYMVKWANATAYSVGQRVAPANVVGFYWLCVSAGTSGGAEPTPSSQASGIIVPDGAGNLLWKLIPVPMSADFGEFGYLTGNAASPAITIRSDQDQQSSYVNAPRLDQAIRSGTSGAGTWRIPGYTRGSTGGVQTTDFTQAAFSLTRGGVYLKDNTQLPGLYLRTTAWSSFQLYKDILDGQNTHRLYHQPKDASFNRLLGFTTDTNIQYILGTNVSPNAANTYNEGSDTTGVMVNFCVAKAAAYDFICFQKGAGNFQLAGFGIAARGARISNGVLIPTSNVVELFNLQNPPGRRDSVNIPTVGKFPNVGEYIWNVNNAVGQPKGWTVTTAGFMADSWAISTAVLMGEIWIDGGKAYAANGSFTTKGAGSGPSAASAPYSNTGANIPEVGFSSLTAGVATWDYLGVVAVLRADVNW